MVLLFCCDKAPLAKLLNKYSEGGLTECQFTKATVVRSPLGLVVYSVMSFGPGFQLEFFPKTEADLKNNQREAGYTHNSMPPLHQWV